MFGGYGFMEEYPLARMYRDVRVTTIGGGSSEIMREIIAKMVIDDVAYESPSAPDATANGNGHAPVGLEEMLGKIQHQAAKAKPLGNTLKFDFGEEQLFIDGTGEANAVSTDNKAAACTVEVGFDDFQQLMRGKLDPMSAVMTGKVKIEGDMGVAMKLQSLFG